MAAQVLSPPTSRAASKTPVRATPSSAPAGREVDEGAHLAFDLNLGPARAPKRLRVPKQEVADLTAQLAIMTKSGLDLASALSSLASQCERPLLAEVLHDVNELVLSGNTLSESLRQHPEVFDGAYVATIAAAEASGRMAEVLQQLAQMQRNEMRLRTSIKSMLTYPVLLVCISSSVIMTLVIFVLPRFAEIFAQNEMPLPVLTRALISTSVELKTRWWLWLPTVVLCIGGATAWRLTETGRRTIDVVLVRSAILRNVTQPLLTGRLCRLLGLLLNSGVPLLEGLKLCREAVGNRLYKAVVSDVSDSVVNGRGMGAALMDAEIIPLSAREMLMTSERTGNLAEVATLLGEYYEEEAEAKLKQAVRILEPLITVVMGAVVAVVVLSVMLPIFDLSNVANRQ